MIKIKIKNEKNLDPVLIPYEKVTKNGSMNKFKMQIYKALIRKCRGNLHHCGFIMIS